MLLISEREMIKEELLFLIENGELLLSSKRYDEFLEKLVNILSSLEESLSLYRFLELLSNVILILEKNDEHDSLDFLIMALDLLQSNEEYIDELDFESINLDTFLLQSTKQHLLHKSVVQNLSILNLLKKEKLEYFLKFDKLNLKIFNELKDIDNIDIVLAPFNEFIIQKIRKMTNKPIIVVSSNDKENIDRFDNIFFVSNKLDEDEFNEAIIEVLNSYECKYVKEHINNINNLKPLGETITKLQNIDENTSLRDISKIISSDLALSTKLVSLVNKPFFGVVKEITSVNQAITFLGKEKTLAYAFSLEISEKLGVVLNNYGLSEEKFNKINFLRLQLANLWYRKVSFSDFIVISSAAMLGNIGKLFLNPIIENLDNFNKERFSEFVKFDRIFAEKDILDTTTEKISANLLTHWGFSNELINSIYYANNIDNSIPEYRHLAIANYVIFNTFDLNDEVDDKVVSNMVDFLNEMNFDSNLYLEAIDKIKSSNS
jgi:HD-like signal output (HDOD) protein